MPYLGQKTSNNHDQIEISNDEYVNGELKPVYPGSIPIENIRA